mmetsp:Transcript_68169/g.215652  ORF Transcript_68169/g.215652 Transcript_68169/m.215652 type:complete len:204 (-) Transcript_68169:236-847(-)
MKSRGCARPLAPMGPRSGSLKCPENTSRMYPREGPSGRSTEKRIPRGITRISPGGTRRRPISERTSSVPCWGTIKKSPSALQRQLSSIPVLAVYMWMANPSLDSGPPAPHMVVMPRTKSVFSSGSGIVGGRHLSWLGVAVARLKSATICSTGKLRGWKGSCVTEGRIRYIQVCWLSLRGTVNAVPEICSQYNPYGHTLGLFWP